MSASESTRLLEWCAGNRAAADMLVCLGDISQIADDFADGDIPEDEKSARMCEMLMLMLVKLPANPFWRVHMDRLCPVLATALLNWDGSNTMAKGDDTSKAFAFVLRESLEDVLKLTALICGDLGHARDVVRQSHDFYRDGETLEEFANEHG